MLQLSRIRGGSTDALLHRMTMFRAARRWVLRGLPLTPPGLEDTPAP
jgi:hypothetical protein